MRRLVFAAVAACVLAPTAAGASGYGLREHSADSMGSAYAGSSASTSDASYMIYNPAALGFVDNGDFALSVAGIFPDTSSHYSATTSALTPVSGPNSPDGFVSDAAVPSLALRWRVAERWFLGVSVSAPWGLATPYPHDWVGRYYARDTELKTVNIAPVIAYEVSPRFVIAAGPQVQYADGEFSEAVDVGTIGAGFLIPGSMPGAQDIDARFKADGWGWGWTVGAIAQVNDAITLGVAYQSSVDTDADGDLKFKLGANPIALAIRGATGLFTDTDAKTSLTTPATLRLGGRARLNEEWTLLAEADWTDWTAFDELRVEAKNPAQPDDVTASDWEDTWFFALGAEYSPNDRWTFRVGTAFDESPIPDSTRGPRIPDSDRTWISLGLRFRAAENVDVSLSAAHLFFDDSTIRQSQTGPGNTFRGNLNGDVEAAVNIVAVQLSWRCP